MRTTYHTLTGSDMVRVDGIEPTTSAWKADVLPLNYTRMIKLKMPRTTPLGQVRNFNTIL